MDQRPGGNVKINFDEINDIYKQYDQNSQARSQYQTGGYLPGNINYQSHLGSNFLNQQQYQHQPYQQSYQQPQNRQHYPGINTNTHINTGTPSYNSNQNTINQAYQPYHQGPTAGPSQPRPKKEDTFDFVNDMLKR